MLLLCKFQYVCVCVGGGGGGGGGARASSIDNNIAEIYEKELPKVFLQLS